MSGTGMSAARARIADVYFFEELRNCCGSQKAARWLMSQGRTRPRLSLEETKLTQTMERASSAASDHTVSSDSFKSKRATPKAIDGIKLELLSLHDCPSDELKKSKSHQNLNSRGHC
ncbi:hypothetical protein GUITHDRAFT_151646, partial [Guillardia theta CCMP2712]